MRDDGRIPSLVVIKVGSNAASQIYVGQKIKVAKELGIKAVIIEYNESVTEEELIDKIKELNLDPQVNGLIVQLPLPEQLNSQKILNQISIEKDVDGILGVNPLLQPVVPLAIASLLEYYGVEVKGKSILVIGNGPLVGLPLTQALLKRQEAATIVSCTKDTIDLKSYTICADVIIAAAGCPNLITKDMLKQGVVIIDASINRIIVDGKHLIVGDSHDNVHEIASFLTPVPGGVGPVAVVTLIKNTIRAC